MLHCFLAVVLVAERQMVFNRFCHNNFQSFFQGWEAQSMKGLSYPGVSPEMVGLTKICCLF